MTRSIPTYVLYSVKYIDIVSLAAGTSEQPVLKRNQNPTPWRHNLHGTRPGSNPLRLSRRLKRGPKRRSQAMHHGRYTRYGRIQAAGNAPCSHPKKQKKDNPPQKTKQKRCPHGVQFVYCVCVSCVHPVRSAYLPHWPHSPHIPTCADVPCEKATPKGPHGGGC